MEKRSVIFDWSGVVKDAIGSHLWVVNRILKDAGAKEISVDELRENWKQPFMVFFNKYLPNWTIEEETAAYREAILSKDCPRSRAFPGIIELIKKLKQNGAFVAVITGDFSETIFPEIKEYDLENIFDEVVIDALDKNKALNDLIKKYNIRPEKAFFVGDTNQEIEAGKQAGVKTIAVTWGSSSAEKLKAENPDFIVNSIVELEKIIFE